MDMHIFSDQDWKDPEQQINRTDQQGGHTSPEGISEFVLPWIRHLYCFPLKQRNSIALTILFQTSASFLGKGLDVK